MYGADTIKEMIQKYGNGTGLVIIFCAVSFGSGEIVKMKRKNI